MDDVRTNGLTSNHNFSMRPAKLSVGLDYVQWEGYKKKVEVFWEPESLTNCHIGIVGTSGSGKTYFIRKFMSALPDDVLVEVFDYHGDINPQLPGTKSLIFSQNTRFGYNPLIINTDKHYGGPLRAMRDVIAAINATTHKLGGRQVAVLQNLMLEAYEARGIYQDKPESWEKIVGTSAVLNKLRAEDNKEELCRYYPTLQDILDLARRRLRALYLSVEDREDGKTVLDAFDDYSRAQSAVARSKKELARHERLEHPSGDALDKLTEKRDEAIERCVHRFRELLDGMETGRDLDDVINYSNKDILQSVYSRLESLIHIGLFEPNPPPWGDARVRRYNLRPLAQSTSELVMFIRFRLQAIIREMMQEGESGGKLRRLVILDESKIFNTEEPDNPINIIATQMRKFGLGMLLASQSPVHLSDDFVKNAGTFMLLNLSTSDWDDAARSLKINKQVLTSLKPQRTAAMRLTLAGESPRFRGLILNENGE